MKYQEKVAQATEYYSKLKSGLSNERIDKDLSLAGFKSYEIEKIRTSANKVLREEYHTKIKKYLLEGDLDKHLNEFDLVSAEQFEQMQHDVVHQLKQKTDAHISEMLRTKTPIEKIYSSVSNPFYTDEDFKKQIEKFDYYNKPNQNAYWFRLLGVLLIIISLIFTASSYSSGKPQLFYGALIAGILFLIKGYKTQSDLDYDKKNKYYWRTKKGK